MSLDDLARSSGVARAGIANLEAGRGNPTLETLWALASALSLPFGSLITDPEPDPVSVLRASEGLVVTGGGERVRLLNRVQRGGMSETYDVDYIAGDRHDAPPHYQGVVEHLLVTDGRMLVGPTETAVELDTGDHITFAADVPHIYTALNGPARACIVMDYPPERSARRRESG